MTRRRSPPYRIHEPTTFIITLLTTTSAHILPQRTTALPYQTLNVLPYPIPTAALFPRQQALNTICGYIGGDPELAATCSAGSHCAVDVVHNAIGCCPDGDVACTAGVYTDCVDSDSSPQNVIDPYVFTCGSGDGGCFRNEFEGGYFQYGCGGSAATVKMTASGKTDVELGTVSVELTEQPSTLSEPTTLGAGTRTKSATRSTDTTESDSSSSATEGESTTATRTTERPSATETSDGADNDDTDAPGNSGNGPNTGAIIGGTLGGVAFVAMVVVLALYLWRRRKGNSRQGPGQQGDTKYIRYSVSVTALGSANKTDKSSPMTDPRHPFEPLSAVQEVDESRLPRDGPRPTDGAGAGTSLGVPDEPRHTVSPYWSSVSSRGGAVEGSGYQEKDSMPLTSEMGMSPKIVRSADHHPHPVAAQFMDGRELEMTDRGGAADSSNNESGDSDYGTYPGPRRGGGGGALWQQNRVQTKNMNWL
ncbi:uncharacterized protein J7T54_006896 [Emericellopsis cladophorae]|uniref:Mid2 domain-containing protein n=1 Tax=Emericellopsis cladophorae TaxID=2686198 RepID=A0A9Q0BI72_9HYPO|nr:uncharacterized protein J7T54_006896 [Emericellopsis cladophorae]KAI6785254.1 hypothetical protein J7T54_006896 [Emericellopsis cladophorae]